MKTLVMAAVLLTSGAVWAQDDVKQKVEQYLKDLGSDSYETREKASTELKKIGPPAVEALKKAAAESPDAEVRTRAEQLMKEIEKGASKPAAPKPGRIAPPGPGMKGASVSVQNVNGNSTITITPAGGAPFTFKKNADGPVSLDYTDGDGKEQTVKADSIEAFLKEHKELAASFGITKEGIDYGGTVVSFDGANMVQGLKGFRGWKVVPFKKGGEDDEEDEDGLEEMFGADFPFQRPAAKAAGAAWEPVSDVLRSQLEIAEGQGLVVKSVGEDTVASRAGLKKHDILLEIDGTKVTKAGQVKELLKKESKALVIRGGKRVTTGEEKK
jgi:hypothetical protein